MTVNSEWVAGLSVYCKDVELLLQPSSMTAQTLDQFLASVERRAFRMALFATRNEADAMDIVQDTMMRLVQNYRQQGETEWPLLFQRILQNRLLDWHRQRSRLKRLFWWSDKDHRDEDDGQDWTESLADPVDNNPQVLLSRAKDIEAVNRAVEQLPIRQQQAFLLRAWEGYDVADTAAIMQCSAGSVKTHYFRALNHLRQLLEAGHDIAE